MIGFAAFEKAKAFVCKLALSSSALGRTVLFAAACAGCSAGTEPLETDDSVETTVSELTNVVRGDLFSPAQYPDVLLDAADSTAGWSSAQRDTTNFKRGSASLSRASSSSRFFRSFATPVDVSKTRFLTFWYYIDDPSKIVNTDQQVEIGSAGTYDQRERNWNITNLKLHRGWNYVVLDIAGARHRTAADGVQADLTKINWFRIYHHPNATITTRIDHILFTNRPPASFAFAQYLDQKESLIRHPDGNGLAEARELTKFLELSVSNTARKRECRRLQLLRQRRAVSQVALDGLGIAANGWSALRTVEAYVCGEQTITGNFEQTVRTLAKDYLAAEVTLVNAVATRFALSPADAAETLERLFQFDYSRIVQTCGTVESEVLAFVRSGTKPAGISGPNALFRNCPVSSQTNLPQEIAVSISGGRSLTSAGDRYRACWDAFASQASDCTSPYASAAPLEGFESKLRQLETYRDNPNNLREAVDAMRVQLDAIEIMTFDNANQMIDEYNDEKDATVIANVPDTDPPAGHPRSNELEALHDQYDEERGRAQAARIYEERALSWAETTQDENPDYSHANRASAEAFHETAHEHDVNAEAARAKICEMAPEDDLCKDAPPPEPPSDQPGEPKPGEGDDIGEARCAEFSIEGSRAWYEVPSSTPGVRHELNAGDRMEHCLCEALDRQYADLPQFMAVKGVNVSAFCPLPEERVMHECTEPGWDDGPASPLCRVGLVSNELDHTGLTAKLCWAMRSATCPDPRLLANGECNCYSLPPFQPTAPPPRRCQQQILCPPDSVPDDQGCGCRSFEAPRVCAGNVLTDTKPFVNVFSNIPAIATRPALSVSTSMPLVTRAVTPSALTNGNQFAFKVLNPDNGGAATGTAEIRCTNLAAGVSNYLVERVSLANIGSGALANVNATFSATDLDRCFGTSRNQSSHFEISLATSRPISRVAYVSDLNFTSILDPIFPEQPCTLPTVGPIPRPTWNMSTGQVLRRDLPISFPTMLSSGVIAFPSTIDDPTFFERSYAPSSLALMDRGDDVATTSELLVTREGNVSSLTLQLDLRGDWGAQRFSVALIAPDGSEVHRESGLSGDGEAFDAGILVEPSSPVSTEGTWTLEVYDVGGNADNLKSGDLYSWSLNLNPTEAFDETEPAEQEPGSFPAGWSCDGQDGFEDVPGEFYGDGGCDCGCGALDVDCASNDVSECEYNFCDPGHAINPANIATCL